jgi:hypothetical protein
LLSVAVVVVVEVEVELELGLWRAFLVELEVRGAQVAREVGL